MKIAGVIFMIFGLAILADGLFSPTAIHALFNAFVGGCVILSGTIILATGAILASHRRLHHRIDIYLDAAFSALQQEED